MNGRPLFQSYKADRAWLHSRIEQLTESQVLLLSRDISLWGHAYLRIRSANLYRGEETLDQVCFPPHVSVTENGVERSVGRFPVPEKPSETAPSCCPLPEPDFVTIELPRDAGPLELTITNTGTTTVHLVPATQHRV